MTKVNQEALNENITFETAFQKTVEKIDDALYKAPMIIRKYVEHLGKSRGKLIRAFSLLTCSLDEKETVNTDAVSFAAAIEILHLATLVHDDVMDDADMRRGTETLQKKYGKKTAVICGDYLLSAALKQGVNIEDKDKYKDYSLPEYVERVCAGELSQHINNGNLNLSTYRYLTIISGKTAALFEASFYAGAVTRGYDEKILKKYKDMGRYIGMIFQLTDDCIDFETDESIAQKNVQSDFEQGVITLPLIYTFQKNKAIKDTAAAGRLDRKAINAAVAEYKGLSFTKMVAKKYYDKAEQIVSELNLKGKKRDNLITVLEKAYNGPKKTERQSSGYA